MRAPEQIIKRPLLTEKGTLLKETGGGGGEVADPEAIKPQLLFEVAKDANKVEIRHAVEKLWDVQVQGVRTVNYRGKTRRSLMGRMAASRAAGKRPSFKKAFVKLAEGDQIEFYEAG